MNSYRVVLTVQQPLPGRGRRFGSWEEKELTIEAGSFAIAIRRTITALEGYRPGGLGEKMTIEVERTR